MSGTSSPPLVALAAVLLAAAPLGTARADAPMEAALLEVSGEQVTLNKGSADGIVVGQIFDLYQEAKVFMLPLTNADVPVVKKQQRVARVQVIKAEPSTSLARVIIHDPSPDGRPIPLVASSLRAIHNPTAIAPNRKPVFIDPSAPPPTPWRRGVAINLQVSNERDDGESYVWSATGGRLLHERTIKPSNVWHAPPKAGDYTITVQVLDTAGNEARTALSIKSSGVQGLPPNARAPTTFKNGAQFGAFNSYSQITDLAFDQGRQRVDSRGRHLDPLGRTFFLKPRKGWGGKAQVRVYSGETQQGRLTSEERDLTRVASDGAALFLLDSDRKTVFRFGFGGNWSDLFKKDSIEFGVPEGGRGNARFQEPVDLAATQDGELYVLDAGQKCVQVFTTKGKRSVFLVSFGRPGKEALELDAPKALALGRDGTVYVLDNGRKRVVVYKSWRPVHEFQVGAGEEPLLGIAVDPFTSDVYVLGNNVVKRFGRDGKEKGTFGEASQGELAKIERPVRIRIDPSRVVWVVDREGESVARFSPTGQFLGRRGGFELSSPLRVAGGPRGEVVVLDTDNHRVTCFDPHGWATARFGSHGTKASQFQDPVDVAVSAGGEVLVLDAGKAAVLRFSPQGRFVRALGSPGTGSKSLTSVRDLSVVNDRRYATVVQQRPEDNFNLLDAASGESVRQYGRYGGDMTPRLGCVVGVSGDLAAGGSSGAAPWFWSADDDRERIHRQRRGGKPVLIKHEFDEITDMEVSPVDQVYVVDHGESQIVVLNDEGGKSAILKAGRYEDPWDIGLDDYGHLYIYDKSTRRVVELIPAN